MTQGRRAPGTGGALSGGALLALAVGYLIVAFSVYRPALDGPPISDDFVDLLNPWILDPSPRKLLAFFDPTSQASISLTNYKPVSALVHVLQAWLHPQDSLAYHAENVLLHVLASVLLVMVFASTGIAAGAAALGGLFFLVHPANVESVAWMRQLWTPLCMAFALGALLALPRRPGLATLLFMLSLGSKAQGLFALPVAAVLGWSRGAGDPAAAAPGAARPWPWRWLGLWTLIFLAFSIAQAKASAGSEPSVVLEPWTRLWTSATFPLRYLLMALASFGVGANQEPPPVRSWLDPWWLASLVVLPVLVARTLGGLRERDPEAAGWVWAAAGFAPVSQIVPFVFPIADRWLYFILPGILLAALHVATRRLGRMPLERRRTWGRLLAAATFGLCMVFSEWSFARAALWRSEVALLVDAARRTPDGMAAHMLLARRAAAAGDVEGTLAPLRAAHRRGWDWYQGLLTDPVFAPVRSDPRFQALVREFAHAAVERLQRLDRDTQQDLIHLADAHRLLGQDAQAEAELERALAIGGAADRIVRDRLERLRREAAR